MRANTQDEFEALLMKQSLVLNRPPVDFKRQLRFMSVHDFSLVGLRQMLEQRVGPNGTLEHYRGEAKRALQAWTTYNRQQIHRLDKPICIWLEQISKNRAHVNTIEKECRELNRLISIEEAKGHRGG